MKLVIVYGAPGVGKLTVARELGRLTGFKVFDNHASLDFVSTVFTFDSPPHRRLVKQFRLDVLEEAARQDVDVIFTFVYGHPDDYPYIEDICRAVESYGGDVCFVQLICEQTALEQRVQSPERASHKLATVEALRDLLAHNELFTPVPYSETFLIDNTDLSPAEVATLVARRYELPLLAESRG
jgi:hypothetical protein